MSKSQKIFSGFLIVLLPLSLCLSVSELYTRYKQDFKDNDFIPGSEAFNPSLIRLNTINKMVSYADSSIGTSAITDSAAYANFIGFLLRERFYHGYSHYKPGYNTIGWLLAPLVHPHMRAIVIPDDIMKYPHAACSQQAIVGMEIFKKKGFNVRKVGFYNPYTKSGHFCFEVYYKNEWHFYDSNLEPNIELLNYYNRPSFKSINAMPGLISQLYNKKRGIDSFLVFSAVAYGEKNEFPAKKAMIYQLITRYTSLFLLFICLILTLLIKYKKNPPIGG